MLLDELACLFTAFICHVYMYWGTCFATGCCIEVLIKHRFAGSRTKHVSMSMKGRVFVAQSFEHTCEIEPLTLFLVYRIEIA